MLIALCLLAIGTVVLAGSAVAVDAGSVGPASAVAAVTGAGAPVDAMAGGAPDTVRRPGASDPTRAAASTGQRQAVLGPREDAVQRSTNIRLEETIHRTPDRPGSYDATSEYRLPASLTALEVRPPAEATVLETEGFEPADAGGSWQWDGTTERPHLRFRMPANRTTDRDDPLGGPGDYTFVDAGAWGIVQRPGMGHSWGWSGTERVGLDRSTSAEEGAAGDTIAYLGPHEEYQREAAGQTFRLIVPERATLAEDPQRVLDEFAYAAEAVQYGDRDGEVFAVAAPTEGVQWGVRGLKTGDADLWTRDVERFDDVENVWLHEYVHTRQDWTTASDATWVSEAVAVYYASLLALEREHVPFEAFRNRLQRGAADRYDSVVLQNQETWTGNPDYTVGALTAAHLDRRVRLATDGEASLQTILRRASTTEGPLTANGLTETVREIGGDGPAQELAGHTGTTDRTSMWAQADHEAAYGTLPARMGYRLADERPLRVTGPYRNRTLSGDEVLVPGETLRANVTVENAGGTAGPYDARLAFDGATVDERRGRLEPGASTTVDLSGGVGDPGPLTVQVADRRLGFQGQEPARASVTDLAVERPRLDEPGDVRVHVTVENDAARPAERSLQLRSGRTTLDESTVGLDAGERRTLTRTVSLQRAGRHRLGVAGTDHRVDVVVGTGWQSVGTLGGVALVALVGATLLAFHRRPT